MGMREFFGLGVNRALAMEINRLLDKGLPGGLGVAQEGKMCVEAAVTYAYNDHSQFHDKPTCVNDVVRHVAIHLNDSNWISNHSRAEGLRRLAIAQLGSNQLSVSDFNDRFIAKWNKEVGPFVNCVNRKHYEYALTGPMSGFLDFHGLIHQNPNLKAECREEMLRRTADCAVDVLIEMESPGVEFLDLIDEAPSTLDPR